jgi:hypothetical protein
MYRAIKISKTLRISKRERAATWSSADRVFSGWLAWLRRSATFFWYQTNLMYVLRAVLFSHVNVAAHNFYTVVLFSRLYKHFLLIIAFASYHARLCQLFLWRNILLELAIYFCRPPWRLCKLRSAIYLRPKVCPFTLRTKVDADITWRSKLINRN